MIFLQRCKVALATFMLFSPVWVFSWFLKLLEVTDAKMVFTNIQSCLISAPDVVQHSYEVFWLDPQVLLFWGFSVRQHILPNQWHFNYLSSLDRCSHIVYILRFFSRMSFQMCPKIASMNRCKVALATCMRFFPCVSFLMVLQVAWSYMCKVTLIAFVLFFSRISFQMRPQTACMNRCKVALATFMWIFHRVSFLMVPQVAWSYICKVTLFTFVRFFSR